MENKHGNDCCCLDCLKISPDEQIRRSTNWYFEALDYIKNVFLDNLKDLIH